MWIATHFTPRYWDYWAQVDKKLHYVFTRSDRPWYFGQSPPRDAWEAWQEPAWLRSELLFRSPFCFPTRLWILPVCFLLLTLRSERGAKGLGPIKHGSRWQPGGILGRRYEISSVLEDLLSALRSYLPNRCCCTICLRESHTKQILSCSRRIPSSVCLSLRYHNPLERLRAAYVKGARSRIHIDEPHSPISVQRRLTIAPFLRRAELGHYCSSIVPTEHGQIYRALLILTTALSYPSVKEQKSNPKNLSDIMILHFIRKPLKIIGVVRKA